MSGFLEPWDEITVDLCLAMMDGTADAEMARIAVEYPLLEVRARRWLARQRSEGLDMPPGESDLERPARLRRLMALGAQRADTERELEDALDAHREQRGGVRWA